MKDTQKFRVILPIEVEGRSYEFGSVVELSLETARQYSHALIAFGNKVKKEASDGGNG